MVLPVNEVASVGSGIQVTRRAGSLANIDWDGTNFDIFTITGGPIEVFYIFGEVTTVMGAGQAVPQLQYTPAAGAATGVNMCIAATRIDTDADDTLYYWTGAVGGTLMPMAGPILGVLQTDEYQWDLLGKIILLPGLIDCINAVACTTGVVDWYIAWRQMVAGTQVVAAA